MQYGICLGVTATEEIKKAGRYGFDYTEVNFSGLARCSDEEYAAYLAALDEAGIRCEAANCFVPGDLRVTGKVADRASLEAYVEKGMERGKKAGLETVVFGSGGARNLDDSTDYITGFRQLAAFLKEIACPIAEKYGIRIVIEPLRHRESNIINTVTDGANLAAASGCENAGGLADLYHMVEENDSFDNIRRLKGNLFHAHISYPHEKNGHNRYYPTDVNEYDYAAFLDALIYAGCERCSIEAGCDDFDTEAKKAIEVLRQLRA